MENMYDKAYELASLIKKSDQASEYEAIKKKVYADENKKRMIQDYNQLQFEAQAAIYAGQEVPAELQDKLRTLVEIMKFDPDITSFFAARYAMQTIAGDMLKIISEACDLDTPLVQE